MRSHHFRQEALLVHILGHDVLAHGAPTALQHVQTVPYDALAQAHPALPCNNMADINRMVASRKTLFEAAKA